MLKASNAGSDSCRMVFWAYLSSGPSIDIWRVPLVPVPSRRSRTSGPPSCGCHLHDQIINFRRGRVHQRIRSPQYPRPLKFIQASSTCLVRIQLIHPCFGGACITETSAFDYSTSHGSATPPTRRRPGGHQCVLNRPFAARISHKAITNGSKPSW